MNNSDEDLPKLDKCIIHDDIVRFIKDCFEGTDAPGWAQDNMDVAMCFFTEGHIPSVAVDQLCWSMHGLYYPFPVLPHYYFSISQGAMQ